MTAPYNINDNPVLSMGKKKGYMKSMITNKLRKLNKEGLISEFEFKDLSISVRNRIDDARTIEEAQHITRQYNSIIYQNFELPDTLKKSEAQYIYEEPYEILPNIPVPKQDSQPDAMYIEKNVKAPPLDTPTHE